MGARGVPPLILSYTIHRHWGSGAEGRPAREVLHVVETSHATVTDLLRELQAGNTAALGELFPLVYGELRSLAHRQRRRWRGERSPSCGCLSHACAA